MLLEGVHSSYYFDLEKGIFRQGGKFSTLYKGVKETTGSPVLVKTLSPGLAKDADAIKALRYEAGFRFRHPGLMQILDHAKTDGTPFLVLEYLDGTDLKQYLNKHGRWGRRHWRQAVAIILKLLEGLQAMHEAGAYHRDLKPSNILLLAKREKDAVQQVKILDYGLAIREADLKQGHDLHIKPFSMIYAAPEQVLNFHSLTAPATDIYTLALVLYEMITGNQPFAHEHPLKLMTLQLVYTLPKHRAVPKSLFEVLQKATAKHVFRKPPAAYTDSELRELLMQAQQQRYLTATAFAEALREVADAPEDKSTFRWPWQ